MTTKSDGPSGDAMPEVREEYFGNEPVGVEAETVVDGENSAPHPWDPSQIRVVTKQFSLRHLMDLIRQGDLDLAPDFQRNTVWKEPQKARLIESVLLEIPLPVFYFSEDVEGRMAVVDGLQRLSTIRDFTDGAFALFGLEYLDECEGKWWPELPRQYVRRLHNTQIVAHVIAPTTPSAVTYDIFKRINTGGTPLNSQEIRHCMSRERSRTFLRRCAAMPEFQRATGGVLQDHQRMYDREFVLRWCAFRLFGVDHYLGTEGLSMDDFLREATERIDGVGGAEPVPALELDRLAGDFREAMANCWTVFGRYAFRKLIGERRQPLNRTLFESWSIALTAVPAVQVQGNAEELLRRARELFTDFDYLNAVTSSTGDPSKVRLRFERAAAVVHQVIGTEDVP